MTDNKTATERLREMLDARGVEWESKDIEGVKGFHHTRWQAMGVQWCYVEFVGNNYARLKPAREFQCTPEQAIAATLGDDDYERKIDALLCYLTNGKFSKSRQYSLDFMKSCVDEEYETAMNDEIAELKAALNKAAGNWAKADAKATELESLSKLKRAGSLRFWRATIEIPEDELHEICDEIQAEHEQAIAATLGSKPDETELTQTYDAGFRNGVMAVFQQLEGIEDYEGLQELIAEYWGEGEGYDEP